MFRNADLRFGGGDGTLVGSMGSAGSFAEEGASRSLPCISMISNAERVRVRLCVGARKERKNAISTLLAIETQFRCADKRK